MTHMLRTMFTMCGQDTWDHKRLPGPIGPEILHLIGTKAFDRPEYLYHIDMGSVAYITLEWYIWRTSSLAI